MDEHEQQKLVDNERLKLLATFLNGLAVATFAVGALAPLMSNLYATGPVTLFFMVTIAICVFIAFGLHYIGSVLLKRLRS